ncbi:hypothetical protein KI387_020622, partial [Taxus chinensis]
LAAKGAWRLISTNSLWTAVIEQKYFASGSLLDWIWNPNRRLSNVSIIWKAIIKSFEVVGSGLAWRIGN